MKTNCLFCDSTSHTLSECTFNFNRRRHILETCMLSKDGLPDFKSYTKKELKFVAYITPNKKTILRTIGPVEWEYDPIPLTLCKSKLEKAMSERWETMQEATKQETQRICDDGCSICTGKRCETYYWSIETGEWILSENDHTYKKKITTKCGHTFCVPCLNTVQWLPNYRKQRPKSIHPNPNHVSHHMSRDVTVCYKRCPVCKTDLLEDASDRLREDYYYNNNSAPEPLHF